MPFTFSHPIAAIPFRRLGLSLSALVLGSITPDIPYFIQMRPAGQIGHTLAGLFYICLPSGLLLLYLFHGLVKEALFELLPSTHQQKLYRHLHSFKLTGVKDWLLLILAILLGASTHIIWDSFTHDHGLMVSYFEWLRVYLFHSPFGPVRVFKFLQHASTVLGAALLVYLYWQWLIRTPAAEIHEVGRYSGKRKVIISGTIIALGLLFSAIYTMLNFSQSAHSIKLGLRVSIGIFIVSSVTFTFINVLVFSLCAKKSSIGGSNL